MCIDSVRNQEGPSLYRGYDDGIYTTVEWKYKWRLYLTQRADISLQTTTNIIADDDATVFLFAQHNTISTH